MTKRKPLNEEQLAEAARLLGQRGAAARQQQTTTCAYPPCGIAITGTTRKRYCSDSHRTLDNRRRKLEEKTRDA